MGAQNAGLYKCIAKNSIGFASNVIHMKPMSKNVLYIFKKSKKFV